jgi:hypothetical protein
MPLDEELTGPDWDKKEPVKKKKSSEQLHKFAFCLFLQQYWFA